MIDIKQIRTYLFHCLWLLTFFLSPSAMAELSIAEQLRSLNAQGLSQEAYTLASESLAEHEGDADFDLQFGIAAVDVGDINQGIFAIQRVIMLQPTNMYARLELARAYFLIGDDERSAEQFNYVLASNPPADVQLNTQRYLDAIKARAGRRKLTGFANFSLRSGYDSNVSSSVEDDGTLLPVVQGNNQALCNSGRQVFVDALNAFFVVPACVQEVGFVAASVDGRINYPLSKNTMVWLSSAIQANENNANFIETLNGNISAGLLHRKGKNDWNVSMRSGWLRLDDDPYRTDHGLTLSYTRNQSKRSQFSVFTRLGVSDYELVKSNDANTYAIGAGYNYLIGGPLSAVVSLTGNIGRVDAKQDSNNARNNTERDTYTLSPTLRLKMSNKVTALLSARYARSEYAGFQPFFERNREDKHTSISSSLTWRAKDNLYVTGGINWMDNESNIGLYESDRTLVSVSLRYALR